MELNQVLLSKELKGKAKTEMVQNFLISKTINIEELISTASKSKAPEKATCIEALEYVSQKNSEIISKNCFDFVVESLADKAPRVKWESARVIANTAYLFPKNLNIAISNLLANTEHIGTVVRWSAALALGEILKLGTSVNKDLIPAFKAIIEREEKNSIKKIYSAALKKLAK